MATDGFDTAEIASAGCEGERRLGIMAQRRLVLAQLLKGGMLQMNLRQRVAKRRWPMPSKRGSSSTFGPSGRRAPFVNIAGSSRSRLNRYSVELHWPISPVPT